MKKYSVVFLLLFSFAFTQSTFAQADAISKYFSKYMDNEDFTVVYVSGKMFSFFQQATEDLDAEEVKAINDVVEDMKGLRILTTDKNAGKFFKEASSIINKSEYEVLMTVREGKNENVQFLVKETNGQLNELLLLVGDEGEGEGEETGEFVLMSFVGAINLNEISKLEKAFKNTEFDYKNSQ